MKSATQLFLQHVTFNQCISRVLFTTPQIELAQPSMLLELFITLITDHSRRGYIVFGWHLI